MRAGNSGDDELRCGGVLGRRVVFVRGTQTKQLRAAATAPILLVAVLEGDEVEVVATAGIAGIPR